jgi:hypothetical protein
VTAYQTLKNRLQAEPCTRLVTGIAGFIGSSVQPTRAANIDGLPG